LGTGALPATTFSFTAFDPHAAAQYIQHNGTLTSKKALVKILPCKSATSAPAASIYNALISSTTPLPAPAPSARAALSRLFPSFPTV